MSAMIDAVAQRDRLWRSWCPWIISVTAELCTRNVLDAETFVLEDTLLSVAYWAVCMGAETVEP